MLALAGLATILSCGDNPAAPGEGSTLINANGSFQTIYHYADSVVHPSSDRDPALSPDLLTTGAGLAAAASVSASGPTYKLTAVPFEPEAAPTTSLLAPTAEFAVSSPIPIGFTFAFFGKNYTQLQIAAGGLIGFGTDNVRDGCCSGRFISRVDPYYKNFIAVGWSLWVLNGKSVRYDTRGTAPNRRFVVQFNNLTEDGGTGVFTAQLVLYEHSNDIVMYTTALSTSARSHAITQGLQNLEGTEAAYLPARDSTHFSLNNDGLKFSVVAANTAPVVTAPPSLNVNTGAGVCAANVSVGVPDVQDDAAGSTFAGVRSDGLALDAAYPKGVTTITWTATDVEGLSSSAPQLITVSDKENPSVVAGDNISVRVNKDVSFASVPVTAATAADNCPNVTVLGTRSDNAPVIAGYPIGVTTITWTATDAAGNKSTAAQTVSVRPNSAPSFTFVPASLSMNNDERVCSAKRDIGMATATDDLPGVVVSASRSDGAQLSDPFPVGSKVITWTATDVEGLKTTATQTVTVVDNELPSIQAPADIAVRTDVQGTPVNVSVGNATATDNCLNPLVSAVRSDGQTLSAAYAPGTTTITWIASDASNNKSSATQRITVTANKAPVLSVAEAVLSNTDRGACTANVSLVSATATDDLPGVVVSAARSDNAPMGSPFRKGVTVVTWTATDVEGASASGTQSVTVNDKENPSLVAPENVSVGNDPGQPSAFVNAGNASAADNCPDLSVRSERSDHLSLSSAYPVGSTTITWSAVDASGNSASAVQTVLVRDVESPKISVPADFSVNATQPSGAFVTYAVNATDNVGVSAFSCDRASGSLFPNGYTTVKCSARDAAGNSSSSSFGVEVISPEKQVKTLMDFVVSLNLPNGDNNPLVNQLRVTLSAVLDPGACTKLDDFVHMVNVKDDSYSADNAHYMINEALRIEGALGCAPSQVTATMSTVRGFAAAVTNRAPAVRSKGAKR